MISRTSVSSSLLLLGCLFALSNEAVAGNWSQGSWGQMYWGTNTESKPVLAPVIVSIESDSGDVVITLAEYAPGDDGWSTISGYIVQCGDQAAIVSDASPVRVLGLPPGSDYTCVVSASNALGQSPAAVSEAVFVDEGGATGLPIWLLYEATKK